MKTGTCFCSELFRHFLNFLLLLSSHLSACKLVWGQDVILLPVLSCLTSCSIWFYFQQLFHAALGYSNNCRPLLLSLLIYIYVYKKCRTHLFHRKPIKPFFWVTTPLHQRSFIWVISPYHFLNTENRTFLLLNPQQFRFRRKNLLYFFAGGILYFVSDRTRVSNLINNGDLYSSIWRVTFVIENFAFMFWYSHSVPNFEFGFGWVSGCIWIQVGMN